MGARPDFARDIAVFTTPAGIPSSGISGQDTRLGNWLDIGPPFSHWGILVYDDTDASPTRDTFFELFRPGGGIGVLRRSWQQREAEERFNSTKIVYQGTGVLTTWNDDEIEKCGNSTPAPVPSCK